MDSEALLADWPAPAKLNLMLRIVGRRADGYHRLQTVFQLLDWCDRISFAWRSDGRVTLARPLPGVPPERDLAVRAAKRLQRAAGIRRGVEIRVEKRLPMGGGLGGGSSDAATVLVALNALWRLGLSEAELIELGVGLGADVPVFIKGRAAWAEGVGEELVPLALPEPWYVVVVPSCQVSTAAVFAAPDLTRNSPPATISDFLGGMRINDCLSVVRRLHPEVDAALEALSDFGAAQLTGTGACVFVAFSSREAAERAAASLARSWRVRVARGLNRSPLLDKLAQLT